MGGLHVVGGEILKVNVNYVYVRCRDLLCMFWKAVFWTRFEAICIETVLA